MVTDTVSTATARKHLPVGGVISLIVLWSVMAGLRLEASLFEYLSKRASYDWIGNLILGLTFLLVAIVFAVYLKREIKTKHVRVR